MTVVVVTYEDLVSCFEQGKKIANLHDMPKTILKSIFLRGRSDLLEYVRLTQTDMTSSRLAKLLLKTPVEAMHAMVEKSFQVPYWRELMYKAAFHVLSNGGVQLSRELFAHPTIWEQATLLSDLMDWIHTKNVQTHYEFLFGNDLPEVPTFLERVIPSQLLTTNMRLCLIQIIIRTTSVTPQYARHSLLRHINFLDPIKVMNESCQALLKNIVRVWASRLYVFNEVEEYKWLCTQIIGIAGPHTFSPVYEMGLVDFIVVTEELIPKIRTEQAPTLKMLNNTVQSPIASTSELRHVIRYTNWLVDIGRSRRLSASMVCSLIQRLLFGASCCTDEAQGAVRRLLFSVACMPREHRINVVQRIFETALHFTLNDVADDADRGVLALYDILGETGHFSSAKVMNLASKISDDRQRKIFEHVVTVSQFKIFPVGTPEYHSLVFVTMIGTGVWPQQIASVMLKITQDVPTLFAIGSNSRLIFEETFTPHVFGVEARPDVIRETTFSILTSGESGMISKLNERMRSPETDPHCLATYIATANAWLDGPVPQRTLEDYMRVRVASLLGDDLSLRIRHITSSIDYVYGGFGATVEIVPLAKIFLRVAVKTEDYAAADDILARAVGFSRDRQTTQLEEALDKYPQAVGPLTLSSLLKNFFWPNHKLLEYAQSHVSEYVEAIVWAFNQRGGVTVEQLLTLTVPIRERIKYSDNKLTLGDSTYRHGQSHAMLFLEEHHNCSICQIVLGDAVFMDENDNFGIFYCKTCAEPRGETTARAMCLICKENNEELAMRILPCKHLFCSACLDRVTATGSHNCQMCFADTRVGEQVKAADAIARFLV